jgi:hypothetical protein
MLVSRGSERTYCALGYRFRVASSTGLVDDELHRHLRPFLDDRDAGGGLPLYRLTCEGNQFVASLDGRSLCESTQPALPFFQLLWRVSYEAIPTVRDHLAFHAGAVRLHGQAIVLPAPSGSGKSTLVAALVLDGAGYLSDEVAPLVGGMIEPFWRPLSLKRGTLALLGDVEDRLPRVLGDPSLSERLVAPDDLRPDCLGEACPLRLVVFPAYQAGAPTVVEPISRAAGVVELISNCVNFGHFGGEGLHDIAAAARRARFYRLRGGDLAAAVAAVRSLAGPPTDPAR